MCLFIMEKIVASFSIKHLQILDENGNCDEKLMPELTQTDIKKMYEWMLFSRMMDDKMLKMQRSGKMGTFASIRGQEASNIGSAYAMQDNDWLFPSFRENGSLYVRGVNPVNLLQVWGGDERGHVFPDSKNVFPMSIPVGSHLLHAVGAAWAAKLKGDKIATVVYFGDGATSEGDCMEALNFAGVFQVPCVFICQNNQWAISVPRKQQTAAQTLAQKAIGAGIFGYQVDGNDIFAVFKATKEALDKARSGQGPTFIECLTYRMGDHTTADDSTKYRDPKELEYWKQKDPIDRLRKYMVAKKFWSDFDEKNLLEKITQKIEQITKEYESIPLPKAEEMFQYTFAEMDERQKKQMEEMKTKL